MSFLMTNIQTIGKLCRNGFAKPVISIRNFSCAPILFQTQAEAVSPEIVNDNEKKVNQSAGQSSYINKDRSVKIPVETSIEYMKSEAYKITYGDDPVWKLYRRNFKGQYVPKLTRRTCVRAGVVSTGNPCPICRDEYLVLDYRNTKLLHQFISPHNGETLSFKVTNICQRQYKHLLLAIKKAKDIGFVTYDPPHRVYNYSHWYKRESTKN